LHEKSLKPKNWKINFKFQYFQIKPSFTTLYKHRHISGFVATGHICLNLTKTL